MFYIIYAIKFLYSAEVYLKLNPRPPLLHQYECDGISRVQLDGIESHQGENLKNMQNYFINFYILHRMQQMQLDLQSIGLLVFSKTRTFKQNTQHGILYNHGLCTGCTNRRLFQCYDTGKGKAIILHKSIGSIIHFIQKSFTKH